ncbi:hypothetical protein OH797_31735 [Streptomyces anulatus]|uniref:hypothetical protein n=1 Tax=Streptomyces anulatus TaxID=1892 RepID=UPI003866CA21
MTSTDELWRDLTAALNALEDAGEAVHFGSHQDASTGWHSVPYVVAGRRCRIEVEWDQAASAWRFLRS